MKELTNASKYLKDDVDIYTLSSEIVHFMNGVIEPKYTGMIVDFFNCPIEKGGEIDE